MIQDGISVSMSGKTYKFYGSVLLLLGDTLAAHDIGGFKVGVGFALRICRHCMATRELSQTKVCFTACRTDYSMGKFYVCNYKIVYRGRFPATRPKNP